MGFVVAVLWVVGFILAWHMFGFAAGLLLMIFGPLVAAALFCVGR